MTPAVRDWYLLYAFGWISMRTTRHLGFCPVYTFNGYAPYIHALYFYGVSKKSLHKPRATFENMLFQISHGFDYYLQLFC
jgi:hypothetical protein